MAAGTRVVAQDMLGGDATGLAACSTGCAQRVALNGP
jgi:hypothetical protein